MSDQEMDDTFPDRTAVDLRLPEELVLLSYHLGDGHPAGRKVAPAVAGAELMELMLCDRIRITRRKRFGFRRTEVEIVDPTPMDHPVLDELLGLMARRRRPRTVKDWVYIRKHWLTRYRAHLLASGALALEESRGRFTKRYRPTSSDRVARMKGQMHSTLLEGGAPNPREMALAVLFHASGLINLIADKSDRNVAKRTVTHLPEAFAEHQTLVSEAAPVSPAINQVAGVTKGISEVVDAVVDVGDSGGDGGGGYGGGGDGGGGGN